MLNQSKGPILLIGGGLLVFIVALVVVLTSLSGAIVEDSLKEIKVASKAKDDTKAKETRYIQELGTYKGDIRTALDKAKFESGFVQSNNLVKSSEAIVVKMNAIIERDDHKEEPELKKLLMSLKKNNGEILKNNSEIVSKKNELVDLIKNIDTKRILVQSKLATNKSHTEETVKILEKAAVDHPEKKVDIEGKVKKSNNNLVENAKFSDTLKGQIDNKEYASAYQTIKAIEVFTDKVSKENLGYRDLMAQLYKSYSKILTDMKVTYHVSVGRSSWDNWSEYDDTKNYVFPSVEVSENDAEKIGEAVDVIASGNPKNPSTRHAAWVILRGKINPGQSLGSGHDDSEFWVEDITEKYYHKYVIVENTKKTETGWVAVPAPVFENNVNNLGMEIVSKPYGKYESEKSTVPTPAGLRMVGNSRYGEWKSDNSGNSFWHYYGMYSFWGDVLGSRSYNRYDYDSYRNHRRTSGTSPYYGSKKEYGTYGSHTRANKKYSGSTYMKSSGGNAQRGATSKTVRGAGSSSRGRGAAGGGK